MKKFKRVVLALIILAGAGYSGLWYTQATVAKEQVVRILEMANKEHPIISYESITNTGFPMAVGVSINKPVFDLPVSELLKPMAQAMPVSPDGTGAADTRKAMLSLPNWQENFAIDGSILITVDALSNTYKISSEGDTKITSSIGDDVLSYTAKAAAGDDVCYIAFNKSVASQSFANMWNWQLLSEDPMKIVQNVQSLDCEGPAYSYVLDGSGEMMMESKPYTLNFANASKGEMFDFSFGLDLSGLTATTAYDKLLERYYALFADTKLPMHYYGSIYGEQSAKFKGVFKMHEAEPQTHPIHIEIEEFAFHSDISNTDYSMRMKFNPTGENAGSGEFQNRMTISANEQGYKLYLSQIEEVVGDLYAENLFDEATVSREKLGELLKALVPNFHELGEVVYEIDVNGVAEEDGKMNMAINNIEVGATPYGLKGGGALKLSSILIPIPTGNVDLACRSCDPFVTDLVGWFGKLKPLLAMSEEPDPELEMFLALDEEEVATRLKSFLRKIDSKGKDNLDFAVKLTEAGAFTVNELDSGALMVVFNEEIVPLLMPKDGSELEGEDSTMPEAIAEKADKVEAAKPAPVPMPVVKKPVAKKPVTKKPAAKKPVTKKKVVAPQPKAVVKKPGSEFAPKPISKPISEPIVIPPEPTPAPKPSVVHPAKPEPAAKVEPKEEKSLIESLIGDIEITPAEPPPPSKPSTSNLENTNNDE